MGGITINNPIIHQSTLRDLALENLYEFWRELARSPLLDLFEKPNLFYTALNADAIRAAGLIPANPKSFKSQLLNSIFMINELSEESLLSDAITHYQKNQLKFCYWYGENSSLKEQAVELLHNHFEQSNHLQTIAMQIDTEFDDVVFPETVTLKELSNPEEFDDWIVPLATVYKMSEEYKALHLALFKGLNELTDAFRYFILYYEGKPIAASTLFLGTRTAGLYNRASLPVAAKLGRRLASKVMVKHEINLAVKAGYQYIASQTNPKLARVIRDIGFETFTDMLIMTPKE